MARKDEIVTGQDLEDEAYDAIETERSQYERGEQSFPKVGSAIFDRKYRPIILREWPMHTDFCPDELTAAEVGRD